MATLIREEVTKFNKPVEVVQMENIANISEWLEPHVADWLGVTNWYQFHFMLVPGNVKCRMRLDCSSNLPWHGLNRSTSSCSSRALSLPFGKRPFSGAA